ncbi:hypothetical protein H8N03_05285 [Ramlibacter sp. USB13]|uniref:DUF883 domain-containing protein n=1 Tax=Ramlibacter cellulosilyticus TaxID=2764187 RepID=A0A923MNI5_9BURK|nr:hypothetical protein [Ramlibacter cellulosilyticus]MBC5782348.1 hypothetical protein [Ramlibacter cellulosilyticus]
MPNPRDRIKQTGDTHLPDVGEEGGGDEDVLRFEPADTSETQEQAREAAAPAMEAVSSAGYVEAAREQIRQRPVVALASAFVLGYLFARI